VVGRLSYLGEGVQDGAEETRRESLVKRAKRVGKRGELEIGRLRLVAVHDMLETVSIEHPA